MHKEWTAIFTEVLFPLITELLKPEVFQSDPVGMSETRVRAATLLSRVFLHYLGALAGVEESATEDKNDKDSEEGKDKEEQEDDLLLTLWLRVVGIMDRLMNSGQGDNLVCSFPSSFLLTLSF